MEPCTSSRSLFNPHHIFPRLRVHTHEVALVEEQRNVHLQAALQLGMLVAAAGRVAFHARHRLDDLQIDRRLELDADGLAFERERVELPAFDHVRQRFLQLFPGEEELIVVVQIHEGAAVGVAIQILHAAVPHVGRIDLLASLKVPCDHRARLQIAQLALHIRLALALAAKLGADDDVWFTVELNGGAGLEVGDVVHGKEGRAEKTRNEK